MIARLQGTLLEKSPTQLVIDVAGVGYEILASLSTYRQLPATGEAVTVSIHTHVREDELVLFGFATDRERKLFRKLIKVNGLGPRLALNTLSGIATQELIRAISSGDIVRLTSIPGIGKKTAERMILDLKDKMLEFREVPETTSDESTQSHPFQEDLLSVLINLGYKRGMAEQALRKISLAEEASLEEAVRLTLRHLGEKPQRKTGTRSKVL